jgi:hypothetical protein
MATMQTVEETRWIRLRMLLEQHASFADLCEKLGYARNETAALNRIYNRNKRKERGNAEYKMGRPMARKIEAKLNLPDGWMDTPPTYSELNREPDLKHKTLELMDRMDPAQLALFYRTGLAFVEPPANDQAKPDGAGAAAAAS